MLNNSFANSLKFSLFDFIGNSIIKGGSKASEMRELLSNNVIDKIGDAISIPQSNTLLNIFDAIKITYRSSRLFSLTKETDSRYTFTF